MGGFGKNDFRRVDKRLLLKFTIVKGGLKNGRYILV